MTSARLDSRRHPGFEFVFFTCNFYIARFRADIAWEYSTALAGAGHVSAGLVKIGGDAGFGLTARCRNLEVPDIAKAAPSGLEADWPVFRSYRRSEESRCFKHGGGTSVFRAS